MGSDTNFRATATRLNTTPTATAQALALLLAFAVTAAAAAVGSVGSASAPEVYAELQRPPWSPPAWLFGPVWTALYASMAVAAWLVWRAAGWAGARPALLLFVAQLAVNALWSWLFFAWRWGAAAFVEAIVLWASVTATLWAFGRIRPLAAWLLVPYLGWVTFAAVLTWDLWRRNPSLL